MLELSIKNQKLINAIKNARNERKNLIVRLTEEPRTYRVFNKKTGNCYTIHFSVQQNGRKFGSCTCKAGQLNIACKHIAAAAALNICLAERGVFNKLN